MTGLTLIHALAGALALGLFVYLGYALLRPENFWTGGALCKTFCSSACRPCSSAPRRHWCSPCGGC